MAHHKRGRRKKARAGCLLCKPHKMNGVGTAAKTPINVLRRMQECPADLVDV